MYFEQTCVVYLIVRPSVGRGLRLEDVSRGTRCILSKRCCLLNCRWVEFTSRQEEVYLFEQACVVYLIVRPSVGRGLRLEDVMFT